MASIIDRNGTFYAEFFDSTRVPKSRRFSLRTKDKSTARALLAKLERAERLDGWDPWTGRPADVLAPKRPKAQLRFGAAVTRYLEAKTPCSSPYTVRNYRRVLGVFARQTDPATFLASVQSSHIEAFIKEERLSPTTLRYRLTVVRAFLRWCVAEGLIETDASAHVRPPAAPGKLPRAVSEDELRAVCAHVPEGKVWMREAYWFALYTGLRLSELGRLRWEHIDSKQGLLRIERQKNGRAGTVPLSRKALEVLERLEPEGPDALVFRGPNQTSPRRVSSFVTYISDSFRAARESAGISRPITPHGLRHAFCTRLAEAGKSAFVIQAAARHSNVRTSAQYVHIANKELRDELDEVFG